MTDRPLLALDTATRRPTLCLGTAAGDELVCRSWASAHRHGEQLLTELDALLAEAGVSVEGLGGIVAGTGPGSFTGLRIGLATAKVLAYSLELPLVGVPTTEALALAAAGGTQDEMRLAVVLPAGAADRYVSRFRVRADEVSADAPTALVAGASEAADAAGDAIPVAIELEAPEVPAEAVERGRVALGGLGAALLRLGGRRLAAGEADDVATLVPAYVALPRGVARAAAEVAWSPDLR